MAVRQEMLTRPLIALAAVLGLGLLIGYGMKAWTISRELSSPSGQLALAEQALQSGDDRIALTLFKALADKNDPSSQYWLAHMKEFAIATDEDVAGAIALYAKAAQQGNAASAARLGQIYLDGTKVPQDFGRARTYLEQAARDGNAQAAFDLGRMLATGLGVQKDAKTAYAWFAVAVIEGSAIARSERDRLIAGMTPIDQQAAETAAAVLLKEVSAATASPSAPTKADNKKP